MKLLLQILCLFFVVALQAQDVTSTQEKEEIKGFTIYPNPVTNNIVSIVTDQKDIKNIIVFDLFGEVMLQETIKTESLSIANLVAGVYILQVTERNKTMTRKLVVK